MVLSLVFMYAGGLHGLANKGSLPPAAARTIAPFAVARTAPGSSMGNWVESTGTGTRKIVSPI